MRLSIISQKTAQMDISVKKLLAEKPNRLI